MFDLDSTLVKIEGLDLLAERKGPEIAAEVKAWTEKSMNGEVPFEVAMERKMDLIRPSRDDLDFLGQKYMENITEDAREVVQALQKSGIEIGIMTGNFRWAVLPLASMLGIKSHNVYANNLYWYEQDNEYIRCDTSNPLWKSSGKADVMQGLRDRYKQITMVGDGAGDLETKPHVDKFIGFGGIKVRPIVAQQADVFITNPTLAPVLLDVLPAWRRGLRRIRRDPLMKKARGASLIRR